ncbi:FAD:protein FMN transferase [bacterium]|nr:FAD:protein FMN transferase [bacterium]
MDEEKSAFKLVFLLFMISFLCACEHKTELNSITFSGMGTVLSVIYTGEKNEALEEAVKRDAGTVEDELSYYKDSSFVSILNREAHEKDVEVPQQVCDLIEKSLKFGEMSGGFFDITYKSTGALWENNGNKIPDEKTIEEKQRFVGADKVLTDCSGNKIRFAGKGVKIDLGGVAKGYAIDRAGEILKRYGVGNFIVNYGGDMLICGNKAGKPWSIGIKNPDNHSEILKKLEFGSGCGAVATSGDYERFFVIEGQTFSHIMNPKTGKPVKDAKSVTVVAKNATAADVAATAVSVALKNEESVKKIMENFNIKLYTLDGSGTVLKEWRF